MTGILTVQRGAEEPDDDDEVQLNHHEAERVRRIGALGGLEGGGASQHLGVDIAGVFQIRAVALEDDLVGDGLLGGVLASVKHGVGMSLADVAKRSATMNQPETSGGVPMEQIKARYEQHSAKDLISMEVRSCENLLSDLIDTRARLSPYLHGGQNILLAKTSAFLDAVIPNLRDGLNQDPQQMPDLTKIRNLRNEAQHWAEDVAVDFKNADGPIRIWLMGIWYFISYVINLPTIRHLIIQEISESRTVYSSYIDGIWSASCGWRLPPIVDFPGFAEG